MSYNAFGYFIQKRVTFLKKMIVPVLLLMVILATTAGAFWFRGQTQKLHSDNQALVADAEQRLARAKAEFDAIDPSTVEGAERRLESEQAIVTEAETRAAELEQENAQLDKEISEEKAKLENISSDEETAYYLAVYESLHQGMEKVEGYIEGN